MVLIAACFLTATCLCGESRASAANAVHMPEVDYRNDKISDSVAADAEKETRIKVGQAVKIVLKENQTTPYRWYYRVSDEKAIHLLYDHYEYDPNPKQLVGVGGTHYFYFIASVPGNYEIEFQENRIGDGFQTDQRELVYKLTITEQP